MPNLSYRNEKTWPYLNPRGSFNDLGLDPRGSKEKIDDHSFFGSGGQGSNRRQAAYGRLLDDGIREKSVAAMAEFNGDAFCFWIVADCERDVEITGRARLGSQGNSPATDQSPIASERP